MNPLLSKSNTLLRYGMVHLLPSILNLYTVNEFPKSGGSWIGEMVGRGLEIPFPRNCFPKFGSCIMHGHYLKGWGMRQTLVVWRDGRDVMVSWYHHCLFENELNNRRLVKLVRRDLAFSNYQDVKKNLPDFIEYAFSSRSHLGFTWSDFVNHWHDKPGVTYVKYEDILKDTPGELTRICLELGGKELGYDQAQNIADIFSFTKQSGRQPGEEKKDSFMRKGIVGDYRNFFTHKTGEIFDNYAGRELVKLGYEQNRQWWVSALG
ncbi:MAG: sulfotransferase domain-containing protein [Magnetococcales bacterium]|nr:sulfotransferase domain-containing protein [Magnetococcales bacterium]